MELEVPEEVPSPICARCKRPVDRFTVTVETGMGSVKFEAECHVAYEMNRLFERDFLTIAGIRMTEAFR